MIIPREFSKSKEQIDKLKAKAKKDAPKDKKDMADLKREVEMTVHTISPYEGLCEMAHEMSFMMSGVISTYLVSLHRINNFVASFYFRCDNPKIFFWSNMEI